MINSLYLYFLCNVVSLKPFVINHYLSIIILSVLLGYDVISIPFILGCTSIVSFVNMWIDNENGAHLTNTVLESHDYKILEYPRIPIIMREALRLQAFKLKQFLVMRHWLKKHGLENTEDMYVIFYYHH